MRWSEVSKRSPCTRAVATITRSAGSRKVVAEEFVHADLDPDGAVTELHCDFQQRYR